MTNSFYEFAELKSALIIGSNTTETHPVAASLLKQAAQKGARLIVADPRRIKMAEFAALHLQHRVGTDVALLNGIMHVVIREGWADDEFIKGCTVDFEKVKEMVAGYPPERVAEITGVPAEDIERAADIMAHARPSMLIYTMGITQHATGVDNVLSCANLQMTLGNVGFECGGVNPLRGQNNVQGACDMGGLPNVFTGYQKVDDDAARARFEQFWGVKLPGKVGLKMTQMIEGMADGSIKAFYVFGENPVGSDPNVEHTVHCLKSADFLVCQDIFLTETAKLADVVLPAAAWAENDGTFSNSERRVSRVRKAIDPPGNARPDWWIFWELARRLGADWPADDPRRIWEDEIARITPTMKGITYDRIEGDGLQWPVPDRDHPGTTCLHKNGEFACGLGVFTPVEWKPPVELPDERYPLTLTTGRRLTAYHTHTQTGRSEGVSDLLTEDYLEINPADAAGRDIATGDLVRAETRRGQVELKAWVTEVVPQGTVFLTFHFHESNANWLTNPVFDPVAGTPEYKACAVEVKKAA